MIPYRNRMPRLRLFACTISWFLALVKYPPFATTKSVVLFRANKARQRSLDCIDQIVFCWRTKWQSRQGLATLNRDNPDGGPREPKYAKLSLHKVDRGVG